MQTRARRLLRSLLPVLMALHGPALHAQGASAMSGLYGRYDMTRESSGTSWQPDSTPMAGIHGMQGAWMTMLHGYADAIYDDQGGARGSSQAFSTSMLMLTARR